MGNAPGQLGHGGQLETTSVWGLRWTPEERNYYDAHNSGAFSAPQGQQQVGSLPFLAGPRDGKDATKTVAFHRRKLFREGKGKS